VTLASASTRRVGLPFAVLSMCIIPHRVMTVDQSRLDFSQEHHLGYLACISLLCRF
jgi:hypothetical protein